MTGKIRQCLVIGSGPGGAVAAALLAEAGRDVLLLEEGASLPQSSCAPFSLEELRQKYRHGGVTAALGRTKIAYVEGRVVGGGSEINAGLYHRLPPAVLEEWRRKQGLIEASEKDLDPCFALCEQELGVGPAPGPEPELARRLAAGAASLGLESREAPRMFSYGASGWTRRSMSQTFIPRALKAGAELRAGARVYALSRQSGRWLARAKDANGGRISIEAENVFLACGAVQTPALLRRSGLSSWAGRALALHPMLKVVAEFSEDVNAPGCAVAARQVKLADGAASLGCAASAPSTLALGLVDHDPRRATAWRRMGAYYAMAPGGGRGEVKLVPGFAAPLASYRLAEAERRGLRLGLKTLCEALFAAGARSIFPGVAGVPELRGPDDLAQLDGPLEDGRLRLSAMHLMGSCPMGEAPSAVADSFGRVRGHDGLYLCDASALCGPVGVNPQGSVMAFSARTARLFLANAGRARRPT